MDASDNILGCFVSSHASLRSPINGGDDPSEKKAALFRSYIWGETGICDSLKELKHQQYGRDLILVLFKFYVNPVPYLLQNLKEMERYRRNEHAIGVPIVVNDENFFDKSEEGRREFLKRTILQKLDLLQQVVKRNRLDTEVQTLKKDVERILT